jgi:4-amino-4-deoxychorismate lyase
MTKRLADFGLIETLLWTRGEGFHFLSEHIARLRASARELGFAFDEPAFAQALQDAVRDAQAERLRLRFVLHGGGELESAAAPIEPVAPDTVWRVAVARRRFVSDDPLLRHKTTRRELYESELAEAHARCGADEVMFLNEREELCEGARTNLFLARGGLLLTPPAECGLLPGTLRANLLASGRARETGLQLTDLGEGAEFYMGNSVRGLVRAELIDRQA